jgi:uncharacterized protein YbjQ (UPF0145 family)
MIIAFFGGYKMVEGIIQNPSPPFLLKAGALIFLGGIVVLLVSLIREQFFVRRRERYKDYTKIMAESLEQAIDRMVGEAEELGANAIINVRFTTSVIMQSASEILAYGPAVIVE